MADATWDELMDRAEEGGGGEPIPDGPYVAFIDSAQYKTASTGAHMVEVQFKVKEGPYAGRTVYNNFVLSVDKGNALGIFRRHMGVLGISEAHLRGLQQYGDLAQGMAILADWLVGREATIIVGHRVWQGQNRNEVNDVKPVSAVPVGTPVPAGAVPAAVPQPAAQPVPAAPAPAPAAPAPAPAAPAPQPAPAPAPVAQPAPAPAAPAPAPAPAPVPAAPPAPAQPNQQGQAGGAPPF